MDAKLQRLMSTALKAINKRVIDSNAETVTIDQAGLDAIGALSQALVDGRDRRMLFLVEIILELLNELPLPTASGVLLEEMEKRAGIA